MIAGLDTLLTAHHVDRTDRHHPVSRRPAAAGREGGRRSRDAGSPAWTIAPQVCGGGDGAVQAMRADPCLAFVHVLFPRPQAQSKYNTRQRQFALQGGGRARAGRRHPGARSAAAPEGRQSGPEPA